MPAVEPLFYILAIREMLGATTYKPYKKIGESPFKDIQFIIV